MNISDGGMAAGLGAAAATPSRGEARSVGRLLSDLLKAPDQMALVIGGEGGAGRAGIVFLVAAALFYGVFGLAAGLFGGWDVALVAAGKAAMIAIGSLLLCLPSLYVFSAVGGAPLSLRQAFVLGASCLAMVGLLLIGLAPVAWLFSASTASLPFEVLLVSFLWLVSVTFAVRYIDKLKDLGVFERCGGIGVWFVVFVLVSLQIATCMRPLLTRPEAGRGWWTAEKQFFLAHFTSCFEQKLR